MKLLRWVFAIVITIALAPVIAMLSSSLIAALAGCDLNEGTVHTCVVFGADVGSLLYAGLVSAWFALISVPVALAVAAAWIVTEIVVAIRRRSARA